MLSVVMLLCCYTILVPMQTQTIDIERRKNRLLKFCYVPATSAAHNRLLFFFLLQLFTVLMKQTRQVVRAIKGLFTRPISERDFAVS
jgi:hypothetical protein